MKSQVLDQAEGEVAKESEEARGFRQKGERKVAWLHFRSSVPICHHRVRHAYPLITHLTCFVQGFDFKINQ